MTARRVLPALLLLFVGSGCAALIYEIVWFQLLQLVIGSSAVSMGVLLGTFMGGMCLGSLFLLPRVISRARASAARLRLSRARDRRRSGCCCCSACRSSAGSTCTGAAAASTGILLRGVAASICLLPPTLADGRDAAGDVALGRIHARRRVLARLLLRRQHRRRRDRMPARRLLPAARARHGVCDLRRGRAQRRSSRRSRCSIAQDRRRTRHVGRRRRRSNAPPGAWAVYVAIALSGFTALGAEVIWTRLLSLLFGATVYTFSLILAVFLLGLGIGSSIGSAIARRIARPRLALGWCQMLLCARDGVDGLHADAVAAVLADQSVDLHRSLVQLPARSRALPLGGAAGRDPVGRELSAGARLGRDRRKGSRRGWWAASMPRTRSARSSARSAASLLLVVWLGSQRAQQVLVIVSAVSALLMLESAAADAESKKSRFQFAGTLLLAAAMGGAVLLARTDSRRFPAVLVAYGRYAATRLGEGDIIYVGEGWNASVAVVAAFERRAQLPQRRQGPGVERAAGHAAAADARPHDDADPEEPGVGARHRLRRGRDRRRRFRRSQRQAADDRRNRAARAARRLDLLRPAQLRRRRQSEDARRHSTMRGISC